MEIREIKKAIKIGDTVTGRIKKIKQPYGGYLPVSSFEKVEYSDGKELLENENLFAGIVGITVDYLTRFMLEKKKEEAFDISLRGASSKICKLKDPKSEEKAQKYLAGVNGLDEQSVINACKLASFDVWFRDPNAALMGGKIFHEETNPNSATIKNIQIMVERTLSFFNKYGKVVKCGFDFYRDGYTDTVIAGDGDYLIGNGLFDLKVIKGNITSKHTLQILMYWIMGQHSKQEIFKDINVIGVFNPRKNISYIKRMEEIQEETISIVENTIICYK